MRTIKNFDEALKYVNRLGIVSPYKPIGWRQQDLCKIVQMLNIAPFYSNTKIKVHFHRKLSRARHKLLFTVNGKQIQFEYPK